MAPTPGPQIYKACYSSVPVYEFACKGVAVMRRRSDSWLNATQILKVAGFDKPQRTRVLEREVQKGEHEKVQGGYGKYQGTWIPLERGIALAQQYSVEHLLQPIITYQPGPDSPPLAPKHVTAAPSRPRRAANAMPSTSRAAAAAAPVVATPTAALSDAEDGTMSPSPSVQSSASRTPSPIASASEAGDSDTEGAPGTPLRKRKAEPNGYHLNAYRPAPSLRGAGGPVLPASSEGPSYEDIILDYFISESTQVPDLLVNPPADFDPNMSIDDEGHTALHWACAMGRVRVVKLLLSAGADIYRVNGAEQTALMRAVMFSNNYDIRKFPELYELLHRSTLNLDRQDRTVFHHVVDLALTKGKTHAARYYMETILAKLVQYPDELADVINFQDEEGETALTLAARARSKRLVKLLLDHGADPKIANKDGKTAEDYILEDERFRSSPVLHSQHLRLHPPDTSVYAPPANLYASETAQRAAGRCMGDMAGLMDSLAASFDAELQGKERDLAQAHSLLRNIQTDILESRKHIQALKDRAEGLNDAKAALAGLERQLEDKMTRRYRAGWEKYAHDEDEREKRFKNPTAFSSSDAQSSSPQDNSDLLALLCPPAAPETRAQAAETLRERLAEMRERRRAAFGELVRLQREQGTGRRMQDYRRLIANAAGLAPGDVDQVLDMLLENLEAEGQPMHWESTPAPTASSTSSSAPPQSHHAAPPPHHHHAPPPQQMPALNGAPQLRHEDGSYAAGLGIST